MEGHPPGEADAPHERSRLLGVYLRDHHAAAAGGVDLARRLEARNPRGPYAVELRALANTVASDREQLSHVLRVLGVKASPAKIVAARVGERISRLKPNGRLTSYSPLGRLIELETLAVGIAGKRALWRALVVARSAEPRLGGVDLERLLASADRQLEQVEHLRLQAAAEAFG